MIESKQEVSIDIEKAFQALEQAKQRVVNEKKKQDEKGVVTMCKIMEDMRNEAAQKAELKSARETAERMIKDRELSLEKIAHYVPLLSMEELKEIESKVMQLA